ncbi:hypothetical protein [Marmoricola sp. RAF53]|uniref:hypothetical protein n=1 Tax=Marmoricola sp. RAF53 TaxID=3233059 RepID=UPI003F9D9AD3
MGIDVAVTTEAATAGSSLSASLEVTRDDDGIALRAAHSEVDGLRLLGALGRLLDVSVSTSVRGRPESASAPLAATACSRLADVLVRPQAHVSASREQQDESEHDVTVSRLISADLHTADLIAAGARAVVAWNGMHGEHSRRVTVSVGVATRSAPLPLGDFSGYLRLRNVEQLSADDVRRALADAPLQPGGGEITARSGLLVTALRAAGRIAAPRLGSTLLVSHLGRVQAPGVESLEFYPVSGGGSGLSLGAVNEPIGTRVTLRARGTAHSRAGLSDLLDLVCAEAHGAGLSWKSAP